VISNKAVFIVVESTEKIKNNIKKKKSVDNIIENIPFRVVSVIDKGNFVWDENRSITKQKINRKFLHQKKYHQEVPVRFKTTAWEDHAGVHFSGSFLLLVRHD
jgi:hypothetical protein